MKSSSSKKHNNLFSKAKVVPVYCLKCKELLGEINPKSKVDFGPRQKKRKFNILNEAKAHFQELNGDVDMNKEIGDDQFCGFSRIRCHTCNEIIGRRYLSSSGKIDELIGKILLHSEKVKSADLDDEMFKEQKPHGIIEEERRYIETPEKERPSKGRLDEEPLPESKSKPELNEAMSLISEDDEEADEELGALEILKKEQRAQIRMLKNSMIDFSEVIADIDERVRRAEKDVALLHSSLKKVYTVISQDMK